MTVQEIPGVALEGRFRIEAFRPSRTIPVTLFEYVTPGGSFRYVPAQWAAVLERSGPRWLGGCRYVRTIGGEKVADYWIYNLITNEGLSGIAKMLTDNSAAYDTGIKRLEIGTGGGSAVTPTVDDTTLVGGQVRFATNTPTESNGVITVVTSATVAGGSNIYIREVGLFFANDTGTISAGDLLDHSSANHDNTGGGAADLTITYSLALMRKTSET